MRAAWASFAADGDPLRAGLRWPTFDHSARTMSFESSQPQLETDFAERHHRTFWADRWGTPDLLAPHGAGGSRAAAFEARG